MTTRNPYKFENAWQACTHFSQDAVAVLYEIMMDNTEKTGDRINCAKYIIDIAKSNNADSAVGVAVQNNRPLKISIKTVSESSK